MSVTVSQMPLLGMHIPYFALPDTNNNIVSLSDFENYEAILIIFMCNHCPFVKHVIDKIAELAVEYQKKGVAVVGINSNYIVEYPEDSHSNMHKFAQEKCFIFPYLYDESQQVAKEFHAACTPDFFLFDKDRKLVYRGQMDDSRPGNDIPVTGSDLTMAVDAALAQKSISPHQKPSMGCNIKWKPGNEPHY